MIVISTRKDFINVDKESGIIVVKDVELPRKVKQFKIPEESLSLNQLETILNGERILVLVHGYNNDFKKVLKTYKKVNSNLENEYDHIIGFIWPGGDSILDYAKAREKVDNAGDSFRYIIEFLNDKNKSVDVMAHSMGNAVVFDAFTEELTDRILINNFISFAAAIDSGSIEENGCYQETIHNFKNIYVFYSGTDQVTGAIYNTMEQKFLPNKGPWQGGAALGHSGPIDIEHNPNRNVHYINCTRIFFSHGTYKNSKKIYNHVKDVIKENYVEERKFITLKDEE